MVGQHALATTADGQARTYGHTGRDDIRHTARHTREQGDETMNPEKTIRIMRELRDAEGPTEQGIALAHAITMINAAYPALGDNGGELAPLPGDGEPVVDPVLARLEAMHATLARIEARLSERLGDWQC
jgi:hypothetical protein